MGTKRGRSRARFDPDRENQITRELLSRARRVIEESRATVDALQQAREAARERIEKTREESRRLRALESRPSGPELVR
jgi:hypothetical protein